MYTSFFNILDILCLLTNEILNDSLNEFYRTLLINNRVLSENELQSKIQSILIEFEHELSNNFIQSLNIFQNYVQNNQLITLTQSNWKFDIQYNKIYDLIHLIPIIQSNCSCATSNLCFDKFKLVVHH
jgi:hypothetical protein